MPMRSGSTNTMPCSTRVCGGVSVRPSAPSTSFRTPSCCEGVGRQRDRVAGEVDRPEGEGAAVRGGAAGPLDGLPAQALEGEEAAEQADLADLGDGPGLPDAGAARCRRWRCWCRRRSRRRRGRRSGRRVVMASANGALVARALILMRSGRRGPRRSCPAPAPGSSEVTMTGCGWSSEARVGLGALAALAGEGDADDAEVDGLALGAGAGVLVPGHRLAGGDAEAQVPEERG